MGMSPSIFGKHSKGEQRVLTAGGISKISYEAMLKYNREQTRKEKKRGINYEKNGFF
jgi:hypothetical protein